MLVVNAKLEKSLARRNQLPLYTCHPCHRHLRRIQSVNVSKYSVSSYGQTPAIVQMPLLSDVSQNVAGKSLGST